MKTARRLARITGLVVLLFTLSSAASLALPAGDETIQPDAGCGTGTGYDPACDVTHDGHITIVDVQRTAGHWNTHGAWAIEPHDHWGETWSGSGTGLALQSSSGGEGTFGGRFTGYGGIYAEGTGFNGPGISAKSTDDFGGKFTSTNYIGLQVSAGLTAIQVNSAGSDGLYVGSAGDHGVRANGSNYGVHATGGSDSASDYGGYFAGYNGVQGIATGASGYGASFQSNHADAIRIPSAAVDGVSVQSAGADGLYVKQAGNDGLDIDSAAQDGIDINSAGEVGVRITDGGQFAIEVGTASENGLLIWGAGSEAIDVEGPIGISTSSSEPDGEWGLYTFDRIQAVGGYATSGPTLQLVQNDSSTILETGDIVAINGLGKALDEAGAPLPLVTKADAARQTAIMGVVYRRAEFTQIVKTSEHEGVVRQRSELRLNSADGPIKPDDYLYVIVYGPAQVKVEAPKQAIEAGDLVSVSATAGLAAKAEPLELDGVAFHAPGTILGKAMEPAGPEQETIWMFVTLN